MINSRKLPTMPNSCPVQRARNGSQGPNGNCAYWQTASGANRRSGCRSKFVAIFLYASIWMTINYAKFGQKILDNAFQEKANEDLGFSAINNGKAVKIESVCGNTNFLMSNNGACSKYAFYDEWQKRSDAKSGANSRPLVWQNKRTEVSKMANNLLMEENRELITPKIPTETITSWN